MTMQYQVVFTDGTNKDFIQLADMLDRYYLDKYDELALNYKQYNTHENLHETVVFYMEGKPVACGGFQKFDENTAEIKRVYVMPAYRRNALATHIMQKLEERARERGYSYAVLETGAEMTDAVALYKNRGYKSIENYGQYAGDEVCVCMRKKL